MAANILVVTEKPDVQKLIRKALEKDGHKVTSSEVYDTVITKCREENFDLALVDVLMRKTPYDKLIPDIKKISPEIGIVVVTTSAFPKEMIDDTLEINGYLVKPLTQSKIKNVTRRALLHGDLARENRRLLQAVTAAKNEWEAAVDALEDVVFVTDYDYKILRANLATFRRLRKGVKEVIGHRCYEVLHCSDHIIDDCPGKRARDSGDPASETISFRGLKERLVCNVYPQILPTGGGLVHHLQKPSINTEQQAAMLTKYERLFDDAVIPILFVNADDYKVVDANQKAIEFFGYDPVEIFDIDLENLFAASSREAAINNIIDQIEADEVPLIIKILNQSGDEIDALIIANVIEIGETGFLEIFLIPVDLISETRLL